MKACITSILFFLCFGLCAQRQARPKLYTSKITTSNDTITGALHECTDSTIAIVEMKLAKSSVRPTYHEIEVIPVTDLIHIKIRRTGAIGRAVLTLGAIGGLTGMIIGLAGRPEDDIYAIEPFSSGYYAISGALIGGAIGGALGVVMGSGSKKFNINRQLYAYQNHKAELSKYLYKPNY